MTAKNATFNTLRATTVQMTKDAAGGTDLVNFRSLVANQPSNLARLQVQTIGTQAVLNLASDELVMDPETLLGFTQNGGNTAWTAALAGDYSFTFTCQLSVAVAATGNVRLSFFINAVETQVYTYDFEVAASSVNDRTVSFSNEFFTLAAGDEISMELRNIGSMGQTVNVTDPTWTVRMIAQA